MPSLGSDDTEDDNSDNQCDRRYDFKVKHRFCNELAGFLDVLIRANPTTTEAKTIEARSIVIRLTKSSLKGLSSRPDVRCEVSENVSGDGYENNADLIGAQLTL